MCGIVGVVPYKSEVPRTIRARALKVLFSDMMLQTEPRGDDATGVYQVQADGDWMLLKKGEKVTRWLFQEKGNTTDPVTYSDFMEAGSQHAMEVSGLVGHCRKATVGSRGQDNNDNHPFAVQLDERHAILGVHNGTLINHDVIFNKLGGHLTRQGGVDSEAIFHFLYYQTQQGTLPVTGEMLQYMGERIDGAYAVVAMNSRFPNQVVTFRAERTLEFMMVRPLNVVLIASEKKFIDEALKNYEFIRFMYDRELPKLEYTDRTLPERDYRIFDTSLPFPTGGKLEWGSFDQISSKGEVRKIGTTILTDWKVPVKVTSSIYEKPGTTTEKSAASEVKVSKISAASPGRVLELPAKTESAAGITTVQAKLEETVPESKKEAAAAFIVARSLGLSVHYDLQKEVAATLGKTELEVRNMTQVELANQLAAAHFQYGYAMARVDARAEVEEVRTKGREQLAKMEKIADKQKKAQNRIWELKILLQLGISLANSGYKLSESNLAAALQYFPRLKEELGKERKANILQTAKDVFEDKPAQQLIANLTTILRANKAAKRAKAESSQAD